jgi:ABC-2 type transport system permease protein
MFRAFAQAGRVFAMFYYYLRNELWKLFGKKRTYMGFGAFLLAQNILLLFFQLGPVQRHMERLLSGNGYLAKEYISALTVALFMLLPQVIMFMPLYAALVGGDLVAKEAEDGTLRLILARPISRFQLLLAKWFSGAVFSALLVAVLGATALFFARLWFPWRSMFVSMPGMDFNVLTASEGFRLYLFSHLFTATNATVILGVGFMFSCFNMKPAAATILALSFLFLNLVMEGIPSFEPYREWFLTYHLGAWRYVFAKPIPWPRVLESLCILVAFNLTAFLVGAAAFHARDIKS